MTHALLDSYLAHLTERTTRQRRASPQTFRATRSDLAGFLQWWEQTRSSSFDPSLVLDTDLLDWHQHRQSRGVKASTLNRARSTLLSFFGWAHTHGLSSHNPATALPLLEQEVIAPRSTPPEGVDWLLRVASAQDDPTTRLRDLALLTLLSDCGLRSQEAADVQLRDLDLDGETLTVRAGKGGKARRLPLPPTAVRRLRDYLKVRCPNGAPSVGSAEEREALLLVRHLTRAGQPWEPGMQTVTMRKVLAGLGQAAAEKVRAQAKKEASVVRIGELEALARRLEQTSPHRLRHGLAYRLKQAHTPLDDIGRVLGHSRPQVTTVMYGKSFDDDVRDSLEAASRITRRTRREGDER